MWGVTQSMSSEEFLTKLFLGSISILYNEFTWDIIISRNKLLRLLHMLLLLLSYIQLFCIISYSFLSYDLVSSLISGVYCNILLTLNVKVLPY